jgi:aminoglycoside phosphotransferase (APT) family kinase protein
LAPALNLPIPVPLFFGRQSKEYPWPFTGYQFVSGNPPGRLTDKERIASAHSIALFLQKLHQFPVEHAVSFGVPFDQLNRLNIESRLAKLEENVKLAIEDGLIVNAEKILNYLAKLKHIEGNDQHVLVHGDLHFKNILVDAEGKVSGIIDWGDTHIGNRAVDLSFVYSFLPAEGRSQFFKEYGEVDEGTRYLARFKAVFTSVLLLRYAHDQKDKEFIEAAKQSLNLALSD